jgi:hypothetical protein
MRAFTLLWGQMASENLVVFNELTRLITQDDFININWILGDRF